MQPKTTTTSVRIPADLLARFDRLAQATERSRSYHVVKALAAYVAEQGYLHDLMASAITEADADPTALPNREAIASAIDGGLLQPEDVAGADPVGDEEYQAAQAWHLMAML
jgi:predicted transcriptional regulator